MSILVRIGERLYEFEDQENVNKARGIYAYWTGDQNSFENELEAAGIEFYIEPEF